MLLICWLRKIALPLYSGKIFNLVGLKGLFVCQLWFGKGIDSLTFTSICQVSCLVFLKSLIMLFTLEPTMPGSLAALLLKVIRAFGIQLGGGLAYGNA